jgi:hypothetical protein|tara:strand:- start:2724 stop:2903 length:180 start_codon:yes stop_codon:yes gene_type:complete
MGFHLSEKPAKIRGMEPPLYTKEHGWIYYCPSEGEYYDSTTDLFVEVRINPIEEALCST